MAMTLPRQIHPHFCWLNILGETSHEKIHPAGFGHPLWPPQWCLVQSQGMSLEHSVPYSRHLIWSWRLPSSGTGKQAASVSLGSGPKIVWEVSSGCPHSSNACCAAMLCYAFAVNRNLRGEGSRGGLWKGVPPTRNMAGTETEVRSRWHTTDRGCQWQPCGAWWQGLWWDFTRKNTDY